MVTELLKSPEQVRTFPSSVGLLEVLKLMWISWFHNDGCEPPTIYPARLLLSIDYPTIYEVNSLLKKY